MLRKVFTLCLCIVAAVILALPVPARAADGPDIFPLSDIKPGMHGVAYTIFEGDKVEPIDLEVIGVLHNAVGPKEDIILVRLLGEKVEKTGVVAGMSGSPVYFDGKLAGALSLKLGTFTKEAIGAITPIADMLEVEKSPDPLPAARPLNAGTRVPVPQEFAEQAAAGTAQFLVPIETPLIASGLYPDTLARFGKDFAAFGMTMMAGGTAPPSPDDARLKPGDMVGIDLIRGDLSFSAGCTVTTVDKNRILACGHPLFGFGAVQMPLSRAHVLMTLASAQTSTKILTTGATIGTLTQDRETAIMGVLGDGPQMIPLNVTLDTPAGEKQYHFEVIESAQLTPLLVTTAAYNGITGSPSYGEGSTLQLEGQIKVKGHTSVHLQDLFAPTDQPVPSAFYVATELQAAFGRIYSNPYELPEIERIDLRVTALAERRWSTIDGAWIEKNEVRPGDTVGVKVLLRPYRGPSFTQEIPVKIPEQTARGTLEIVVSDASFLNQNVRYLAATSDGELDGLEQLVQLLNRERHNDRLYATLFQSAPTILIDDKELPNAPASVISILDQRQNSSNARLLRQSAAGEWSVEMHQVIDGVRMLPITVK